MLLAPTVMTSASDPAKALESARSLRMWIPLSVALFVLLGSLGLLYMFERHRVAEERAAFADLARVNAGFFERTKLVQSAKMAERLSEIIGVQVFFWHQRVNRLIGPKGAELDPAVLTFALDGTTKDLPDGRMVVGVEGQQGMHMLFVRDAVKGGLSMVSGDAWFSIGIFWVLSLGLGLVLSKWVTRPLHRLVQALPLVGTGKTLTGLPIERRDEIGRLAQALDRTHRSLQDERERRRRAERHAMLGRMAASMAHEIRNPVSAIRLHAELMNIDSPEELQHSRGLIVDEAGRLETLVGQWMSYARPEPPRLSPVEMSAAVRDAVALITPQARHAGVEVDVSAVAAVPVTVPADGKRIRQVLGNLLLNAVQAMPTGGVVEVSLTESGGRVIVEVSDSGAGFSTDALQRLGEPFFSEKEGGMGLGLAVAKEICEAHGGVLSAVNDPAGGACLRVELPQGANAPENDES